MSEEGHVMCPFLFEESDMSHIPPQVIQRLIETVLGYSSCDVTLIGSGATSTAWLITCGTEQVVLRAVYKTTNRPVTYRSEFRILRQLYEQGLPVPKTICTSFDQPADLDDRISAWAITRVVAGKPIAKSKLTPEIARQLGEFLRVLHQLPCSKFGRLDEDSDFLAGQQASQIEGIRARWCWSKLFPYDNRPLAEHPVSILAPRLVNTLMRFERELWEITTRADVVLNHSDLYGEHIFVADEMLFGVIDFGASFIATRGWDFAVLAYYHGWEVVEITLESYTSDREQYRQIMYEAYRLALVVGLYKLAKPSAIGNINKQNHIIKFVSETLALIKAE